MITKEKIKETLSVFHAGDPMQRVYMSEPHVVKVGDCHTLGCFAGWWGYLKYQDRGRFKNGYFEFDGEMLVYDSIADEMAIQMGASSHYDLARFMQKNPDIWGNPNGFAMFTRFEAYGRCNTLTLGDIIEHWDGVIERMPDDGSN